jgi:hypothetical protein
MAGSDSSIKKMNGKDKKTRVLSREDSGGGFGFQVLSFKFFTEGSSLIIRITKIRRDGKKI